MSNRVIFMGTPAFAVPTLHKLIENFKVVAVITQPDRPSGRGRKLTPSPVKDVAAAAGLTILQPPSLKKAEVVAQLQAFEPDVIVVAAFGQILRANVLTLPPFGSVNVHASLLPRWRGAAPI
jgi:methionyl-tRNA formyltransferase